MKKPLIWLILVLLAAFTLPNTTYMQTSYAADCAAKACINVYTQDGRIIIEGKKGGGRTKPPSVSPSKPTPIVPKRLIPKAAVPKVITPKPVKTASASPKVKPTSPRKQTPPTRVKKVSASLSLSDRLVKLLPGSKIAHQPASVALIKVPMIFWCDLPSQFVTRVSIVGEVIDVAMRPSFVWSFGDGAFFATTSSGAPYPRGGISHTYGAPGKYVVVLVATWGGMWTFDGVSRAITGEIHQTSIAIVDVKSAPTIITQ